MLLFALNVYLLTGISECTEQRDVYALNEPKNLGHNSEK